MTIAIRVLEQQFFWQFAIFGGRRRTANSLKRWPCAGDGRHQVQCVAQDNIGSHGVDLFPARLFL